MSEFQYYEFHAVDKPLSSKDLEAVRGMSSRVQLSSRKAVFTYSYSDFRYDEEEVLINYFDFMFYIANWGSKRIMMKFPAELVDYAFLKKYSISVISSYAQDIRIFKKSAFVILDISFSEEDGLGWIEEDSYGEVLLNIRDEIMNGDYRSLFVIWLRFLEDLYKSDEFDFDYSFNSSLIPPNLLPLSASGQEAKDFCLVSQDWLDVMQSYSKKKEEATDLEDQIFKMPQDRMAEYLQMILKDESNLKARLIKELKDKNISKDKDEHHQIQLTEIGEKAAVVEQSRRKIEQKEKDRQELEKMNNILQNSDKIKQEIIENIELGNSKYYKIAIAKLEDLRSMNEYFNTQSDFKTFLDQIIAEYTRKSSFIRMLKRQYS
ncbi:hypothetical protein [Tunicatimonas pelagia]|uniref:hypothetical protein n=1 Tax=Tunicatimonas pelagia TaxID=931531 RepID=UPI002664F739|nr:hypothetical protein [Tunicatimonas pelagia]WKN41526.1 hypothetical protein P0M28_21050 [Tunicatimonas pelagia]